MADRGANVTLVEKGSLGSGSTARSVGGIRSQFSTRVNVELSLASKEVWNTFEERFGVDIGLRKNGYLFLVRTEDAAEQFHQNVDMQRELGAESELLTPAEATEHCPGLDPDPFVAATYNPDDGFADPNLAVQGFAEAARELGVDIRTKTAVTALHREGYHVVGADLDRDDVEIPREDVARTLVAALEAESTYGETFELAAGDEPIDEALQEPLDD